MKGLHRLFYDVYIERESSSDFPIIFGKRGDCREKKLFFFLSKGFLWVVASGAGSKIGCFFGFLCMIDILID